MKNKLIAVFSSVIAIIVLLYLAVSILPSIFTTEGITVLSAEAITYDDSLYVTGIALRDESTMVASGQVSSIDYKVSDGDRVSIGDAVATYSNGATSTLDRLSVENLDRQIEILNESLSSTTQYDLKTLDSRAKEAIATYLDVSSGGNLAESREASADVLSAFIKRNIKASGDSSYYKQILANSEASKSAILSGSSSKQSSVKANTTGYFTSQYDGFEHLRSSDYGQVTPSEVRDILASSPEKRPENYVGKLQHFSYWTFLCTVPESESEQFTKGSSWTIRFDTPAHGTQTVKMSVGQVSNPEGGNVAIVFECSSFNNALYSLRICNAQIILKTYSGFRVNKDSIRVYEGQNGVYVLSGAKLVFKPVQVLYRSDDSDFAVVAPVADASGRTLLLNDSVVVGGKDIYDGKVVNIN